VAAEMAIFLLEQLTAAQLVKNFSKFYVTQRFINLLTRARHWSLAK
jgi:hypothetical protein